MSLNIHSSLYYAYNLNALTVVYDGKHFTNYLKPDSLDLPLGFYLEQWVESRMQLVTFWQGLSVITKL